MSTFSRTTISVRITKGGCMKKKIFMFAMAFVIILPAVFLLSACGDKKVQSITVNDLFVGDIVEYQYGTNADDIFSLDNVKVSVIYDDNSTKVLNSDEYTIEFYKNSDKIDQIKEVPDVGSYSINISYDVVRADFSFSIIPSETPFYTTSLSHRSWTYGEENNFPTLTLGNYQLQEGDSVSYYYIEKSIYDNLSEQDKLYPYSYANDWNYVIDKTNILDAGQYYVFADISFANEPNYTGLTVIDNNTLITVNKKTVVVTPDDATGVSTAEYDYIHSGESTSGGDHTIGDISLKDIIMENYGKIISGVEGYFAWKNPDQTLNSTNDGSSYPIVFVPYSKDNYNVVYPDGEITLPVSIKKGIVGNSASMDIYFAGIETKTLKYDEKEHSVVLDGFDIHNAGGVLKNIVTFKNQNGEDVTVREQPLGDGLFQLYIDGLLEIGTYTFTVSLVDKINYCWEDETVEPVTYTVNIVAS